ncbi:hypothetical protein ACFYR1_44100 [Streptomyces canus]|uniref:hypothetical protein n=1 Tax=Streptomyces canus TaxID=58343 RepID=UPI0036C64FD7
MTSAPIFVHQPPILGGWQVTVHSSGPNENLGTACSDHDLVVFLEGVGVADAEALLDDRNGWSDAAAPPTSSAPPEWLDC